MEFLLDIKRFFRFKKRDVLFIWQRLTRGFDDSETWSLDSTMARFICPRLKRFKEIDFGIPSTLTEEEWAIILDKMIFTFEFISSNDYYDPLFLNMNSSKIEEGLQLFSKYYMNLWW